MFHILFSIIFCGCFYIFHMLNSHDRSCVISQHTFHTISHTFHSFTYLFHSIWWCEKEDIISHGFHIVISHYFSQMCEIVCEKPNENFTCTSHAFHIISSSSDIFLYICVTLKRKLAFGIFLVYSSRELSPYQIEASIDYWSFFHTFVEWRHLLFLSDAVFFYPPPPLFPKRKV